MKRAIVLFVVLGWAVAATASAQSLAGLAEKEEARRKTVKKAARVYTNKDVKPSAPSSPPAGGTGASAESAASQQEGAPGGDAAEQKPAAEGAPEEGAQKSEEELRADDEARWRERMREARAALERSQVFEQALQSRINALWADFTARDDPAQRAAIDAERKKSIAELNRVKADIVAQTKAIADIEEEARRAGVPPGWLR